MLLSSVCAVI